MALRLRDRRVALFGLGKSGLSALRLLVREGAKVTCVDDRDAAALGDAAKVLESLGVQDSLRAPSADVLAANELLVVSPGVPLARPEIREAASRGVEVIGEIELAGHFLPEDAPKVGITGTNGKSTTTALTGELFRQGKLRPFVGGNLGQPLCDAVLSGERHGAYVIELSSFQLEGTRDFKLEGAALLNLTPDHLDRYASHAEYGATKGRIFRHQSTRDVAVVNADDAAVVALAAEGKGRLFGFTRKDGVAASVSSPRSFEGWASVIPAAVKGTASFVLPSGERYNVLNRALRGAHNLENAMAASLLARGLGVSAEAVQAGLDSYSGLPHRLESVSTVSGVEWVNDSKATNVESTLVALAAFERGVWLVLGGKGKGAPYTALVEASRGKVKGVLTMGQDALTIERAYAGSPVPVYPCGTLDGVVRRARELAEAGDTVLLSPACASYDQFKNFEERGDTFKRLVRALG